MNYKRAPLLQKIWLRGPLLGLVLVAVVQCGGQFGDSAKINIQLLPSLPVVVTTSLILTYTDSSGTQSTDTITAPWYEMEMSVTNNSTQYLTLAGFTYSVEYTKNGQLQTLDNQSLTVTNLDPVNQCLSNTSGTSRGMIVEGLAPNTTYEGLAGGTGNECNDYTAADILSNSYDTYFISSLPTQDNNATTYFLSFTANGWFEANARTSTDSPQGPPTERFVWQGFMATQ